jgi:hypothetical protein
MRRELPVRFREGLGVKFPRATRLVICCRGSAEEAKATMTDMMSRLKLTVNESKTHICRLPETFDFLGLPSVGITLRKRVVPVSSTGRRGSGSAACAVRSAR